MDDSMDHDVADADPVPAGGDNIDAFGFGGGKSGSGSKQTYIPQVQRGLTEDEYAMNYPLRGLAVIINNKKFNPITRMNERSGTDQDASNLYQRFKALGFEVCLQNNLTVNDMLKTMIQAAQWANHKQSDCFACAILSHGEEGVVYGIDGVIEIQELVKPFKGDVCLDLAGKPKIFFIQACRGTKLDSGTEVADAAIAKHEGEDEVDAGMVRKIPAEADFLMAYSVVPGHFSWRNSSRGSWFIQAVCTVLEKYGMSTDLLKMMTKVNRLVAYEFESNAAQEHMTRKKQIPCITSMLTKDVYFKPKK